MFDYDQIANAIYNACYKRLSNSECKYLKTCQTRTRIYVDCQSASEMILQFAINGAAINLQVLDYLYIFTYIALSNTSSTDLETSENVRDEKVDMLLELIDNNDLFDDAMKNGKFIKMLVNVLTYTSESSYYANCILAHVFKKFPDWLKANFMHYKWKSETYQLFTQSDVNKYF